MGAPLDLVCERRVIERHQIARPPSGLTTQTRLERWPGSGTSGERSMRRVKFGRDILVRTAVREIQRHRNLRIAPAVGRNAAASRHSDRRPSAPITQARIDSVAAIERNAMTASSQEFYRPSPVAAAA